MSVRSRWQPSRWRTTRPTPPSTRPRSRRRVDADRNARKGSKDSKDRKGTKGAKGDRGDKTGRGSGRAPRPGDGGPTGYLFVALGKRAGVRPADLVGAIANESGVSGRDIGPIKIGENHSVVGVPESSMDTILSAMRTTSIRGKKTKVRRYVE